MEGDQAKKLPHGKPLCKAISVPQHSSREKNRRAFREKIAISRADPGKVFWDVGGQSRERESKENEGGREEERKQ